MAGARSELPEPAVHVELYTGDVRGVVRGKERRDGRDSVRLPKALQRYFCRGLLRPFVDGFRCEPERVPSRGDDGPGPPELPG